MATRNFWIEARIDGREAGVCGGPGAKDGGFELDVWIRHKGERVKALRIVGTAEDDEVLTLDAWQTIDGLGLTNAEADAGPDELAMRSTR